MRAFRMRVLGSLAALVLGAGAARAEDLDAATQRALRAAIMGDAGRVRYEALDRRIAEERDPSAPRVSASMAALASLAARPAPDLPAFRADTAGFPQSGLRAQLGRLLRNVEPRQRRAEARADRRHERTRRVWNSIVTPVAALFTGQFLDLVILPAEGLEQLFVGGRYTTPEERRELQASRRVAEGFADGAATARVATLEPRRAALSELAARRNAARFLRQGDLLRAEWWSGRTEAKGDPRVREALMARADWRSASNAVSDGEALVTEPEEYYDFADLARLAVLDAGSPEVARRALLMRVDRPDGPLAPALDALQAAAARRAGDHSRAIDALRSAAESRAPGSAWALRARDLLGTMEYSPVHNLRDARSRDGDAFWRYVVLAESPRPRLRSLTAEEARTMEARWIRAIRSVFVFDMISRAIASPFLDPMPAGEFFDAAARVPARFAQSVEGRAWMARLARAQLARGRHVEAAESWRRAGEPGLAVAAENRAARDLERRARDAGDAAQRAAILSRLARAFPRSPAAARTAPELLRAEREARGFLRIDREALRAYPELMGPAMLDLPEALIDGAGSNGEVSRGGVLLLAGGGVMYEDAATRRTVELPRGAEATRRVAEAAWPMLRRAVAREEAARPMPRKRIPLALEGGALPGFDIMPGLVPLEPDPALRRLYE